MPLVYSAALRLVRGDEALAKDVAQTVFIDLARKAGSLLDREVLAGWLYASARLAASKAVRGDQRRRRRQQMAASMEERTTPPESPQDLSELKLVLDEAMSELGSDERNAVLIRFFQDKELKEVGLALGISKDAARMQVTRALAKLQTLLKRRGVTIVGNSPRHGGSGSGSGWAGGQLRCHRPRQRDGERGSPARSCWTSSSQAESGRPKRTRAHAPVLGLQQSPSRLEELLLRHIEI